MFEVDDRKYPRSWKELSFDLKLFFVYHGCMMILMACRMSQSHCGDQELRQPEPADPSCEPFWKKAVRTVFTLYFMAVWIAGVSYFWVQGRAFRDGTTHPTPQRTETLTDHGKTVYITLAWIPTR